VTGSKGLVHWTRRHGENEVRLQALHRAPPQQLTSSVVKPEGRTAASVKPEQESCVRLSGITNENIYFENCYDEQRKFTNESYQI
jgi:hypothetical protein